MIWMMRKESAGDISDYPPLKVDKLKNIFKEYLLRTKRMI